MMSLLANQLQWYNISDSDIESSEDEDMGESSDEGSDDSGEDEAEGFDELPRFRHFLGDERDLEDDFFDLESEDEDEEEDALMDD